MNSERANYINLLGVIEADGKVRLENIMPAASMAQWPIMDTIDTPAVVLAEFQNKSGKVVLRQAIGAQALCLHPVTGLDPGARGVRCGRRHASARRDEH